MCGICGQINYVAMKPVVHATVNRMARSMMHRGPDDEGCYIAGHIGLGFRRLSIIDLAGGHQPMTDAEESVWVVFNGEIYNFPALREELAKAGHAFRTRSDTEVIVHGYKQWGDDVLHRLNGMFGLAIWDVLRQRLLVARDPMGIKFVYYKDANGTLLFGSEIRPLLAYDGQRPTVDPVALNLFLRYRYTPSPLTLYKGIRKLASGTMLLVEDGKYLVKRWYNTKPKPFSPRPSDDEATEELTALYTRAVKRQLISDVPVGLLLSGGVDSGLLLGLMNLHGSNWPTFSVGYGAGFRDDELSDAARTAEMLNARHTSLELTKEMFEETLPQTVGHLEEPVTTSSIVPMYLVSQRARQDVKVALVGQGPDELMAGYRRHMGLIYGGMWRKLPTWLRSPVAALVRSLPRNEALKRAVYSLDQTDRMARYQQVFSILQGETIDGLFRDGVLSPGTGDSVLEFWAELGELMECTDELGGFQFLEIRSSLPDELLLFGDKLSMAHSLEVRVPYLDLEIVEFVERLDARYKVRRLKGKWLHRRACRNILPDEILARRKRGFATNVVDKWFQKSLHGKLQDYLADKSSLMYGILDPQAVGQLLEEHRSGRNNHYKILSSLIILEEWMRTSPFVDREPALCH